MPALAKEDLAKKFQKEFDELMSVDDISIGSMRWLDDEKTEIDRHDVSPHKQIEPKKSISLNQIAY